jgi:hypothetical protein
MANPCDLIQCLRGQICSTQTATCVPDPCTDTICPTATVCAPASDGKAECVDPRTLTSKEGVSVKLGGGCGCRVGGRTEGTGMAALWMGMIVAFVVNLRRRRDRRSGGAAR